MITNVLLILALVFFLLGAFDVPSRINWIGLGLASWVLTLLLGAL